jgi:hypothetical protein
VASRWAQVVVDARDPARLARWWATVLSYEILLDGHDEVEVGPAGREHHPTLVFVPVDDLKSGKNRLHLDLRPDDQAAEVERLIDMGARRVDVGQGAAPWVVLADPEGNEFCVLRAATGG